MYGTLPISGPGDGIWFPSVTGILIRNGSAATPFLAGSLVQLDMQNVGAAVASVQPGHQTGGNDDSIFNVCNIPSVTGLLGQTAFFSCEQAIAVGGVGKATLMGGVVTCNVDGNLAAVSQGDALIGVTTMKLRKVIGTGGARVLGYALASASTAGAQISVWFNGYGFCNEKT